MQGAPQCRRRGFSVFFAVGPARPSRSSPPALLCVQDEAAAAARSSRRSCSSRYTTRLVVNNDAHSTSAAEASPERSACASVCAQEQRLHSRVCVQEAACARLFFTAQGGHRLRHVLVQRKYCSRLAGILAGARRRSPTICSGPYSAATTHAAAPDSWCCSLLSPRTRPFFVDSKQSSEEKAI